LWTKDTRTRGTRPLPRLGPAPLVVVLPASLVVVLVGVLAPLVVVLVVLGGGGTGCLPARLALRVLLPLLGCSPDRSTSLPATGAEPKYSVCNDLCRPPPGIFLRSPVVTNNKQILYKK